MLRTLFSFTPFYVCLFWLITFVIHYRKCDTAKRMLTGFLCTCVVLYFCHALYFTIGLPHPMECLWTLCSLSVIRCITPISAVWSPAPTHRSNSFSYCFPESRWLRQNSSSRAVRQTVRANCCLPFRSWWSYMPVIANSAPSTGRLPMCMPIPTAVTPRQ